ncbi:Outer membrane protein TolC [Prevotella aff. ruminicola Tc2-24]|uniref:Outer membrane protein TolC n=1 Tax=Prevotella aff. ruminicola Tc2-24 TaxID=81582 RepID=A0A1I0PX94_9BACT|nr:TolC family protein [Prevotella aff. ruminicola Tc2-24]SEW19216.1 Outer membrane protein TolC [Prevotella aff. ruminicola Tc2-24]
MRHRSFIIILFLGCISCPAQQLTLSSAIQIAQENSYDAMVARLSFMSQYWSYRSFRAELLPAVSLSGGLLQFDRSMVEARNSDDGRISFVENNSMGNSVSLSVDQNIVPLGGKLSVQSYLYRLDQFSYDSKIYNSQPIRLSYTQPLRAYNSLKWQKKTEPLKYENAKRTYLENMEEVAIEAVRLFFEVLAAQSTYQQSVSTLKDRQYLFEIAKKRLDLGTITKSELLQLELSLLNAQVDANNNELTLKSQKFQLFSYLRMFDYDKIDLIPPYSIPDICVNADDILQKALANSTHTLQQKIKRLESEMLLAQAKANKGLQVQLNSEIGFNQTANHFNNAYRDLKNNEIIGLTVYLPIFDWGVSKGRVKMAEADLEVTKTQLEQAHETYMQDIRTNVLQFNIQSSQCQNALRAQDIADERYGITKQRFEAGTVTVTDLNTAQQESENAKAQYIRQLHTFWTNYYNLRKTTLYDWVSHRDLSADFDSIIDNGK